MAAVFTPEDGTGLSGANAYVDLAEFRQHHEDRGLDTTVDYSDDDAVKAAIVKATDYVDKRFGRRFRGYRQSKSQGLEWPRLSAYDSDDYLLDDVPDQLKKAVSEYALLALQLSDGLLPTPARTFPVLDPSTGSVSGSASGAVIETEKEIGPLSKRTKYSDPADRAVGARADGSLSSVVSAVNLPEYPVADEWLQELLRAPFSVTLARGD